MNAHNSTSAPAHYESATSVELVENEVQKEPTTTLSFRIALDPLKQGERSGVYKGEDDDRYVYLGSDLGSVRADQLDAVLNARAAESDENADTLEVMASPVVLSRNSGAQFVTNSVKAKDILSGKVSPEKARVKESTPRAVLYNTRTPDETAALIASGEVPAGKGFLTPRQKSFAETVGIDSFGRVAQTPVLLAPQSVIFEAYQWHVRSLWNLCVRIFEAHTEARDKAIVEVAMDETGLSEDAARRLVRLNPDPSNDDEEQKLLRALNWDSSAAWNKVAEKVGGKMLSHITLIAWIRSMRGTGSAKLPEWLVDAIKDNPMLHADVAAPLVRRVDGIDIPVPTSIDDRILYDDWSTAITKYGAEVERTKGARDPKTGKPKGFPRYKKRTDAVSIPLMFGVSNGDSLFVLNNSSSPESGIDYRRINLALSGDSKVMPFGTVRMTERNNRLVKMLKQYSQDVGIGFLEAARKVVNISGRITQDVDGRYFLSVSASFPTTWIRQKWVKTTGNGSVGIDIGSRILIAGSDGTVIKNPATSVTGGAGRSTGGHARKKLRNGVPAKGGELSSEQRDARAVLRYQTLEARRVAAQKRVTRLHEEWVEFRAGIPKTEWRKMYPARLTAAKVELAKASAAKTRFLNHIRHEGTARIVSENSFIAVEDLSVKNLGLKNKPKEDTENPGVFLPNGQAAGRSRRRGKNEAAYGEILRQVNYKAKFRDAEVIKVGRLYPSSRTCSACGNLDADALHNDRVYRCTVCGVTIDRDDNAARNILAEGLRIATSEVVTKKVKK